MKKHLFACLVGCLLLSSAPNAEAKMIEIWGSGLMGGGWGTSGSERDFFRFVSGGAVGVEAGLKLVIIGVYVDYLRWFGGAAGANLLSINLGGDHDFKLGKSFSLIVRLAGAYYYGTLPDDPTIMLNGVSAQEVNTQGGGIHGGLGLRYTFLKLFSVGITPEFGWHYFFSGANILNRAEDTSGFNIHALAYFRVGLGV